MSDIMSQPYAEWLEKSMRGLVELHPKTISIITIMPDGTTGTAYYNADNRDRTVMCEALQIDNLLEIVSRNADALREIIMGEDEDESD